MKTLRIFSIFSICAVILCGLFLSGCPKQEARDKGPPPPPVRVYAHVDSDLLLKGMMKIFSNEGFRIVSMDTDKKYFKTDWSTPPENSDQRRMFEVFLEPDRFDETNLYLILIISVQENKSGKWHDKEIEKDNDPQFQRILKNTDEMVEAGQGRIAGMTEF